MLMNSIICLKSFQRTIFILNQADIRAVVGLEGRWYNLF